MARRRLFQKGNRITTPQYREGWDRIFGKSDDRPDKKRDHDPGGQRDGNSLAAGDKGSENALGG